MNATFQTQIPSTKEKKNNRRQKKKREKKFHKFLIFNLMYQVHIKCCWPINSPEKKMEKSPLLEPDPTPVQDPNPS